MAVPRDYQAVFGDGRAAAAKLQPQRAGLPQPDLLRAWSGRRGFDNAAVTRLSADWSTASLSADGEIRWTLRALRSRSRQLAMNNDYFRAFLGRVRQNVIGPDGITLQMNVREGDRPDPGANDKIETAWYRWTRKNNCTVDGRLSWTSLEHMTIQTVARDGEALHRIVRNFPNEFGFALQPLEADHLDETYNADAPGTGNPIRMGIERDGWGRAVAFHLWEKNPVNWVGRQGQQQNRIRVPASDLIHIFVPDWLVQSRGVPWAHTAMGRLKMLGAYEEAALVAARVGAAKMGFYSEKEPEARIEDEATSGGEQVDPYGNAIRDAEPGHFERLPPGTEFKEWNPAYPDGELPNFIKAMLRGVAAGLGVAYNTLANDLEGVNYSSVRAGLLDERDNWRLLQRWVIAELHERVFEEWLSIALLKGAVNLPISKFDKFNAPVFRARGWPWVDPEKDIDAAAKSVALGVDSRTAIAARQGRDVREVVDEIAAEQEYARTKSVDVSVPRTDAPRPSPSDQPAG